jgi:hypothetical protein
MNRTRLFLGAILIVLGMTGCSGSPTAPNPNDVNTYDLFATLENTAGAQTIREAQLLLDGNVVLDQSYNGPSDFAGLAVAPPAEIFAGSHTLTVLLVSQTTSTPTQYTVPKFDVTIYSCSDGSLSDYGGSQETFHQHTQSGPLTAGQGFSYSFYSPDCTLSSTRSSKRGHRL